MVSDADDAGKVLRYAQDQAAEAAELRLKVQWLEKENGRLRRRLNKVYGSWTWRAGRVVLFPYHVVQWVLRKVHRPPFST